MTEDEIKALEEDIEWDEFYLGFIDLDYGSRINEIKYKDNNNDRESRAESF